MESFDISYFTPRHDTSNKEIPISSELAQEEHDISQLPFNNVTWVSSHNSGANDFAAGENVLLKMATNQKYSVYTQLKTLGVRGLMIDLEYKQDTLQLVHGLLSFGTFKDLINYELIPFLEEDRDAIITIDIETLGDRAAITRELRLILGNTPALTSRIFRITDERWDNHKEWPTIQEMRDADQRVLILSDSTIVSSVDLGVNFRWNLVMENHWLGGLDTCTNRIEGLEHLDIPWHYRTIFPRPWSRLFTMNHFCCGSGIESLPRIQPDNIGGGDNGWGILYPRTKLCQEANGYDRKPNYLANDWVHLGDAHEVADYLNFGSRLRLGTGQRCRIGSDCATDSCSDNHRCQCKVCDDANVDVACISGCADGEICIHSTKQQNICTSNSTEIFAALSSNADTIQVQSSILIIIQVLFLLKMFLT